MFWVLLLLVIYLILIFNPDHLFLFFHNLFIVIRDSLLIELFHFTTPLNFKSFCIFTNWTITWRRWFWLAGLLIYRLTILLTFQLTRRVGTLKIVTDGSLVNSWTLWHLTRSLTSFVFINIVWILFWSLWYSFRLVQAFLWNIYLRLV